MVPNLQENTALIFYYKICSKSTNEVEFNTKMF